MIARRVYHDPRKAVDGGGLSAADFEHIGERLGVNPAWPYAIAMTESANKPFSPKGYPVLRAEKAYRNRYSDRLRRAFGAHRNWRDLDKRWSSFVAMATIDEDAAIKSHSWGAFQIMGFNFGNCGYATPADFMRSMFSADGQARAFCRFVMFSPLLLSAMRRNDREAVAYHYNGPGHTRNNYVAKVAGHQERWRIGVVYV